MSPRIEVLQEGVWTHVPGTEHEHDDFEGQKARLAHNILTKSGDEQVREVADNRGNPCRDPRTEHNPLVDDVD